MEIHAIDLGKTIVYLLGDRRGRVLIDAGSGERTARLSNYLARSHIEPGEIGLIVLTHSHADHLGSLEGLLDLTGARVAIHPLERDRFLHEMRSMTGIAYDGPVLDPPWAHPLLVDDDFDLQRYGVKARVWHTPGHTEGSISVIWEDRAAVGDTVMNLYPFNLGPVYPPFAEDPRGLLRSWRRMLDAGVMLFYPGHGTPVSAERLEVVYGDRVEAQNRSE